MARRRCASGPKISPAILKARSITCTFIIGPCQELRWNGSVGIRRRNRPRHGSQSRTPSSPGVLCTTGAVAYVQRGGARPLEPAAPHAKRVTYSRIDVQYLCERVCCPQNPAFPLRGGYSFLPTWVHPQSFVGRDSHPETLHSYFLRG